ncbi:hypothetical protein [Diaphorobacter caeni]|uniref:hypothetical protein n=1 Tax=Diaphorobacter caeni TaxID=2784387 RepID=UPI00188F3027|nr:hypothetical protein [Diaphorobacter caeni]MBF5007536.1 hypothetical protein [Diaphorobacter caeni]
MNQQTRSDEILNEARQIIADAQQVLDAAASAHAHSGQGSPQEHRAQLESQLSAEDIAQVEANVQAEMARIRDDIKARSMHGSKPSSNPAATQARRTRQMI